jgi:toxin YhaV
MKKSKGRSPSDGHEPGASRPPAAFAQTVRVNGWTLLADPMFLDQVEKLLDAVDRETAHDRGVRSANTKLISILTKLVYEVVPSDPERAEYRQGQTLGQHRKHWFRAKFGNGRFRLFFRFRTDVRIIVYSWVNDSETLRTYGSRTDAYAVFGRMLDAGNPPDDWNELVSRATSPETRDRTAMLNARLQDYGG